MMHNNVMQQRPSTQCLAAVGNLLYYVCYVIVVSVRNYLRMRLNFPPPSRRTMARMLVYVTLLLINILLEYVDT